MFKGTKLCIIASCQLGFKEAWLQETGLVKGGVKVTEKEREWEEVGRVGQTKSRSFWGGFTTLVECLIGGLGWFWVESGTEDDESELC